MADGLVVSDRITPITLPFPLPERENQLESSSCIPKCNVEEAIVSPYLKKETSSTIDPSLGECQLCPFCEKFLAKQTLLSILPECKERWLALAYPPSNS